MGFETRDWLNQNSTFYVLVFTYIGKDTGHDMMLGLASLDGIPLGLYETARIDGASSRQTSYYVTLPCLKSIAFLTTTLSIINSFKVFREAYFISGGYPHEGIYMMQHPFSSGFVSLDIQKMSAASVMIESLVLISVIIRVRRRNKKGSNASG